jgi:hypothetical protein
VHRVTVYHADGCSLCGDAIAAVSAAREQEPFELELVDIGGDAALEAAYREHLPVVEIDGARAFAYEVTAEELLALLRR